MQSNVDNWTIVVTGIWNVAIFDPSWIVTNVIKGTSLEGKLGTQEIFLDARGVEVRHTFDTLRLNPAPNRFVIGTTSITNDSLILMQTATVSILEILKHTPITGLGINFGFVCSEPTDDFLQRFAISDDTLLESVCGGQKIASGIRRTLPVQDMTCELNHMISLSDKGIDLQLNFHYNASKTEQAVAELKKDILIPLKNIAIKLVDEMYGYEEQF
jgi:hypothetical protein